MYTTHVSGAKLFLKANIYFVKLCRKSRCSQPQERAVLMLALSGNVGPPCFRFLPSYNDARSGVAWGLTPLMWYAFLWRRRIRRRSDTVPEIFLIGDRNSDGMEEHTYIFTLLFNQQGFLTHWSVSTLWRPGLGSGGGVLQQEKTRIDEEIDSYTAQQPILLNGHPFVTCSTTVLSLFQSLVPRRDSTFLSSSSTVNWEIKVGKAFFFRSTQNWKRLTEHCIFMKTMLGKMNMKVCLTKVT